MLTQELDFELKLTITEPKEERFPQPVVKSKEIIQEPKEVTKIGTKDSGPKDDKMAGS